MSGVDHSRLTRLTMYCSGADKLDEIKQEYEKIYHGGLKLQVEQITRGHPSHLVMNLFV
jgi:hypothetical protein